MQIKKATDWLLSIIKQMPAPKVNVPLYEEVFKTFSEDDWKQVVKRYQEGNFYFPIIVYNMDEENIDEHKIMKMGETLGIEYFQNVTLTDQLTGETYTSPIKYLVLDLPGRRLIQHISDKMATAEHNRTTDHLAGQATGVSKAASISQPELTVMKGKGLTYGPVEFMKTRGGDSVSYEAAMESIAETGHFSMDTISQIPSKPKAVTTLRELLLGTGIDSNLDKGI